MSGGHGHNGNGHGDHQEDPIEKAKKLHKGATELIDTADFHGEHAYNLAVEKHLVKDGKVKYGELKKKEVAEAFADSIADHLVDKAKQTFNVDKKLDEVEEAMLLHAYQGTTRSQLKDLVKDRQEDFKSKQYVAIRDELMKGIKQSLYSSALGHIERDHAKDVLKHAGPELEERVEAKNLSEIDVRNLLLAVLNEGGKLGYGDIKKHVPKYAIKEEKEHAHAGHGNGHGGH